MLQGNVDTSHQFTVWPLVDSIGYSDSGEYGIERCGTKSHTFKDEMNLTVDWVTVLVDGTLKVQPPLELADKTHQITMQVTMDDYLDVNSAPI